jgi:hypothetical protein
LVEAGDDGAFDVGIAEVTDEDDRGETDEEDRKERGWVGQETLDDAGDKAQDEDV